MSHKIAKRLRKIERLRTVHQGPEEVHTGDRASRRRKMNLFERIGKAMRRAGS